MARSVSLPLRLAILLSALAASALSGQVPAALALTPNLEGQIARPLRYRPEGPDFVIENGTEFFNRPLYGGNTAFRVDAGDKPEFTLYLPGRGGNLRLGLKGTAGTKWMFEAARITARYRPGAMLYEVRDPLLGPAGVLNVEVLAFAATDGLIVRAEARDTAAPLELVWAYGGVNGQRGARDGDIGTERVPISEYFQLKPEFCRDNTFELADRTFTLRSTPATIVGLNPPGTRLAVADAAHWASWEQLLASATGEKPVLPVVIGRVALAAGQPLFLALQRAPGSGAATQDLATYREVTAQRAGLTETSIKESLPPIYQFDQLPAVFAATENHFRELRERVRVETPDPYLNAAAGALNVAVDAVWDEPQGAVMHGAIAWRTKLLGWRGPFAQDALGWHDRARRNFSSWATRQNLDPIPAKLPPPDEDSNLARSEAALHSNGDISNSHYDMNTVFIDAVFRHLQWTGDLAFARQMWPVIERHLAWERRLFRRPFGPDGSPLYEAYAVIWASDDLGYNGGGVTHASAYNLDHNRQAAQLARLLGHDPAPYEREAAAIGRAMREHLWLADRGWFAEYKDLLGRQLVHPSAALWTFYHTLDAGLTTPLEAWQMTRFVDTQIPHLPVRGPGVPADEAYHMLASSDWMPYSWSINNVVLGEVVHTALGYWQAGRSDEAHRLLTGSLLGSMFMGICPGNVGSMNYLDVYRRESQRDFADAGGVLSRALVEGLFGIKPDLLAGELRLTPGFPESWDHASIRHPDISFAYRRTGLVDTYTVEPRFAKPLALSLVLPARRDGLARVTVDGQPSAWRPVEDSVGGPRVLIPAAPGTRHEIVVTWQGQPITPAPAATRFAQGATASVSLPGVEVLAVSDPQQVLRATVVTRAGLRGEVAGTPGARTVFAHVRQDSQSWWMPVDVDVTPRAARSLTAPDWSRPFADGAKLEPVELTRLFNDRVTQIFKNEYRSPRSPYVSLGLPKQGIGAWAGHVNATAEIDDRGLRAAARDHGGRFLLPNGLPFATPETAEVKNIVFTSQWDNYPREATVALHGQATHAYLLMAGSTYWMQSRMDNGEIIVAYADGSTERLALSNPANWWPIDQDYFIDDFQFHRPGAIPPSVDLKTGQVRLLDPATFKGKGGAVPGGAATVLDLPLDPAKTLQSLTVRTLANEVVIGLMAVTLER